MNFLKTLEKLKKDKVARDQILESTYQIHTENFLGGCSILMTKFSYGKSRTLAIENVLRNHYGEEYTEKMAESGKIILDVEKFENWDEFLAYMALMLGDLTEESNAPIVLSAKFNGRGIQRRIPISLFILKRENCNPKELYNLTIEKALRNSQ